MAEHSLRADIERLKEIGQKLQELETLCFSDGRLCVATAHAINGAKNKAGWEQADKLRKLEKMIRDRDLRKRREPARMPNGETIADAARRMATAKLPILRKLAEDK